MSTQPTRRQFLRRSLGVIVGTAALSMLAEPRPVLATRQKPPGIEVRDFPKKRTDDGRVAQGQQELPDGTTHVGIHWRGDDHRKVQGRARTSADGTQWSAWVDLALEDDPFDEDESFAALLDARGARFVDYHLTAGGGRIDELTITAIGAAGPETTAAGRTAPTAVTTSATITTRDGRSRKVATREDWGCDESLGQNSGSRIWPSMFVATQGVIVHHTATGNTYADGAAEVRAIYAYHARTRGWGDIGYTALIDRFGNVYEGRRGRESSPREILSFGVVAGHCYRHNYGTAGLAVIGDLSKRKLRLSDANDKAMVAALEDLTVYECGRGGLKPDASADFLRSDDTWHNAMPKISCHKDSEATVCPGSSLYTYTTGTLRKNVANRLASLSTPTPSIVEKPLRELTVGSTASFSWGGGAARYEYQWEGWRKINTDDIEYWTTDGWTTQQPMTWTPDSGSHRASFAGLQQGHYTLHVRAFASDGKLSAVEAAATILVR